MADTTGIYSVVARARRRLKLQASLEAATLAVIPATAAALVVVFLVRRETVSESAGLALLVACLGLVVAGGLAGYLRRFSAIEVATRIDRASGLSDRLASACQFEAALAARGDLPDETAALMHAAIDDAVRRLPDADVAAASPFTPPRDGRAALAFTVVAAIVAGLGLPGDDTPLFGPGGAAIAVVAPDPLPGEVLSLEEDDVDFARDLVAELRKTAEANEDLELEMLADELDALLEKAENGELSKKELLEALAKAEEEYMRGSKEAVEDAIADLKQTGKELAKSELTRDLGKALQKSDLDEAAKQLEKLADKVGNDELSKKQSAELAEAMKKAAAKLARADDQRAAAEKKKSDKAAREVKELERRLAKARTDGEKQDLERRLQKKRRDLKRLQRDKEKRDESRSKRALKQLRRNMEQAAKDLQRKQQTQKSRRQVQKSMRDMARNTGKVSADKRKMANQKKVVTQMSDLKEAMRRAKQKGKQGAKNRFGRNQRDKSQRARGSKGTGGGRPGQTAGQKAGQGQGQGQNGGQGQQPGGDRYGQGHDPDLLGDPTARSGNTTDESLKGVHGSGPSVRETVLTAAQKGFASRSYQDVYTRYKTIVEEVISAEKVPSGYRHYVKKYFHKIKPHAM